MDRHKDGDDSGRAAGGSDGKARGRDGGEERELRGADNPMLTAIMSEREYFEPAGSTRA